MDIKGKLASQSALIFIVRIFGAGLVFLVQAAMARLWGQAVLGDYLLVMAAVSLISVSMPLGFHTIGTYFTAEYSARGERKLMWRYVARAYGHIVIMAVLLFGFGGPVLKLVGPPGEVLSRYWVEAAILACGTALVYVNAAILIGLKRPFAGLFADGLFRPMLLLGGFSVATLLHGGSGLAAFLWIIAVGYGVVTLLHFALTLWSVLRIKDVEEPRRGETARWWRFALPLAVINLATDFFFDIDLLLLSGFLVRTDLAIFGVCARLFALVSFGVTALYAVILPGMFEAEVNKDRAEFNQRIGDANTVAVLISVVLFVAMGLGGPLVLLLFGADFLSGSAPLAILCLGLVVRSAFGPASIVLSIHDRPNASLPAVALGFGTLVAGNWLLVPMFGLMGASIAALSAFTLWSASLWWIAKRVTGVDVSILPQIKAWQRARAQAI